MSSQVRDGGGRPKPDPTLHGRGALIVSLVWCAVGLGYLVTALTFPLGTVGAPGPGGYSILVGILLTLAGAGCVVQVVLGTRGHRREATAGAPALPQGWFKMLGMVAGAAFYVVVVSFLGHLISSAIASGIVMWTQGDRNWLRIIGWSLILAVATYYGFAVILQLRLPGPLLVPGFNFQP